MPLKKLSQLVAASPSTLKIRTQARKEIARGKAFKKGAKGSKLYQRTHAIRKSYATAARTHRMISQIGSGVNIKKS